MSKNKFLPLYQKTIVNIITTYLPECTIYLFGSRARNSNQEGADVDVAIHATTPIARGLLTNIRSDIDDSNLPIFVDIIDMNTVSDVMKQQIQKDGIIWKK